MRDNPQGTDGTLCTARDKTLCLKLDHLHLGKAEKILRTLLSVFLVILEGKGRGKWRANDCNRYR